MPPTKKSLGQHWLNDPDSLNSIVALAELNQDDTVLEIGPGPGAMTRLLVERAGRVVAVELDAKLAAQLSKTVPAKNLRVEQTDIRRFNFGQLPVGYKVVANIPYYLSAYLLQLLSEVANPPSLVVLLVQKEVAERVAAKPGSMSLISVCTQLYYQAELGPVVEAELFTPPPKVDSQVLILRRRTSSSKTTPIIRLAKAGFAAKRKTLLNNLAGGLRLDKPIVEKAIKAAGLKPNQRAQELSLEQWETLAEKIN